MTSFEIFGHPCNLFLLDTSARLLATFVCLSSSNNIALHVLHDWNEDACSFIDTGIEWVRSFPSSLVFRDDADRCLSRIARHGRVTFMMSRSSFTRNRMAVRRNTSILCPFFASTCSSARRAGGRRQRSPRVSRRPQAARWASYPGLTRHRSGTQIPSTTFGNGGHRCPVCHRSAAR